MVDAVGRDAEVVHHVPDQEEPPAARLLQPFELCLEVGRLGLGNLALAALVGDADEQLAGLAADADLDRKLGVATRCRARSRS